MNRLGHGVSYGKVLEIEARIANSKLSSSTTLIPNDIQQHIPNAAIYDNIDRLEETLSGYGTKHQANEWSNTIVCTPPPPPTLFC